MLIAVLAAVVLAAYWHPASARAETSLSLGLTDDSSFELTSPAAEALWLTRARALGSRYVRMNVYWPDIAPYSRPRGFHAGDPRDRHYRWALLDEAIREAAAHGQSVLLTAVGAPRWAQARGIPSGVRQGTWFPNAGDFGAFGHALAERYSGDFPDPLHRGRRLPRVRYFQAWNEPNLPNYLMPQWGRTCTWCVGTGQPGDLPRAAERVLRRRQVGTTGQRRVQRRHRPLR